MRNELGALMLWIDRKLNRNQDVLVTKIDSIQNLFETSAEATASSADILEGKTAYNGTTLITGTMENQGAKEATLLAGGMYNIPRGWHDGAGRVTATDLTSQTPGTADAGGILSGLKAWVAGQLINGAMKDRRGVTVTAGAVTQDDEYTYLTVPEEACFNASSKLRTKNSNIKSFVQTQLQAGSVLGTNCEQKYLNSGYSTLFASIIAYENDAAETFTINVSGSNDDVNYANIGMLSTTQNIVSIKNYKYIKLTCYNANGYGKKATWSIQVS